VIPILLRWIAVKILLKWIIFGKVTKVLNYHGQIILLQNLNPIFRRVGTKRNTWVYSVDQTHHFKLLGQKGSIEQEISTQQAGWVQQPDNSDDIHETMKSRSQQTLRAECVMDIKAIHIHRIGELFSKEE
jgi:hypothetical protein